MFKIVYMKKKSFLIVVVSGEYELFDSFFKNYYLN